MFEDKKESSASKNHIFKHKMILRNNSHNPLLANGRATHIGGQRSNSFYNNMKEVSSKTIMEAKNTVKKGKQPKLKILQPKFNQKELSVARKLLHLGQVHSNS